MTTNQESIMPTKIITKSKTQQAIETYTAYPNTAPEDVAEMLGITETAARHCKRIADGEAPSIRGASKYRAVREYIISHPRASVDRIAKACGCSRTYVMQLLNPTSGSIAAEFGDIRRNHIKTGNIKRLPLSVPPLKKQGTITVSIMQPPEPTASVIIPLTDPTNKYAKLSYEETTRSAMVKLLCKEDFDRSDLKQVAVMLVMLDGMVKDCERFKGMHAKQVYNILKKEQE